MGLLLTSLALAAAPGAHGAIPEGPRLAFVKWGPGANRLELLSVDPAGGGLQLIAGGNHAVRDHSPPPFEGPSWAPDGSRIAFAAYVTKRKTAIFVAAPDGSGLHTIPGTVGGEGPVFAADGSTIAFARSRNREPHFDPHHPFESLHGGYSSTTTWTIGVDGHGARRLTPWRNGLHVTPSSFSPDGTALALSREGPRGRDALIFEFGGGGGGQWVFARDAQEPVYSPDGTRIAFVSYRDRNVNPQGGFDGPVVESELYVANADGSGLTRITHTHNAQESAPSWDPSGQRLAYTQSTGADLFGLGLGNVVMEANADGTCSLRVFGKPAGPRDRKPVGLYGPVWQPGPGREAGPVPC